MNGSHRNVYYGSGDEIPPGVDARVTDDGDTRVTTDGDVRVVTE